MESNFEQLIQTLSDKVKGMATTETVVGEEFTLGEFKCKPVIKVGLGFGAGSGTENKKGGNAGAKGTGGGAGVGISPVGFLVSNGSEISFIASSEKKGLATILEKVPDLMEKAMEMKAKKEEKEEK